MVNAMALLEFGRVRGIVHAHEVVTEFAHGKVTNWFGGGSNASTQRVISATRRRVWRPLLVRSSP